MSSTSVRRVIPLVVGWERLPRSFSIYGDDSGQTLIEPVPTVLLETDDGWTLLDTGINTALVRDRPLYERLHARNHEIVPILPAGDGEPLERALAAHGVALADIDRIYLRTCTTTTPAACACSGAWCPCGCSVASSSTASQIIPSPSSTACSGSTSTTPRSTGG